MIKFAFSFISALILFQMACNGIENRKKQYFPEDDYIVMADKITANVQKTLSKRYNMQCIGVTSGMLDCVNLLGLQFQIIGPLIKKELRTILIDCVEEYLTQINNDEPIRPFLKNYPFTTDEIKIAIFVLDQAKREVYYPDIALASSCCGTISFKTDDKDMPFSYKTREYEEYEIAKAIVQKEKENL